MRLVILPLHRNTLQANVYIQSLPLLQVQGWIKDTRTLHVKKWPSLMEHVHYMSGTVLITVHARCHSVLTDNPATRYCCPHFRGRKTKAQRSRMNKFSKVASGWEAGTGVWLRPARLLSHRSSHSVLHVIWCTAESLGIFSSPVWVSLELPN